MVMAEPKILHCRNCDSEFIPKISTKKYCSSKCAGIWNRNKYREEKLKNKSVVNCKRCNKEIIPDFKPGLRKFCSMSCTTAWHANESNEKSRSKIKFADFKRECIACKTIFNVSPARNGQLYCSPRCKEKQKKSKVFKKNEIKTLWRAKGYPCATCKAGKASSASDTGWECGKSAMVCRPWAGAKLHEQR